MRAFCKTAGEGDYVITLEGWETDGNGVVAFCHGGTLPHLGGHALASPGPMLHGAQLSRADLWVATIPGHKDADLASMVARELCINLGCGVSVACGVHVDDATLDELKLLVDNAMDACAAVVGELKG